MFSTKKLSQLVEEEKIDEAKKYITDNIFRCDDPVCNFIYNPIKREFKAYKDCEIRSNFLPPMLGYDELDKNKKKYIFISFYNWFMNCNYDRYNICMRIDKPHVFEEDGIKYINLFKGYKWKHKPYESFPENVKENVDFILQHLYEVFCGSDSKSFDYLKFWLAHALTHRKVNTLLYLRSLQGTGKSIITSFILKKMIPDLGVTTGNVNIFVGWNHMLKGKILLVLEEPSSCTKEQFRVFSGKLKDITTNDTLEIRQKYADEIYVDNYISIIIPTNKNFLILEWDDRRNVILDIDDRYKGDHEYFNKLASILTDETAEAFFCYLYELARSDEGMKWNENIIPVTKNKKELVHSNLPWVYQYLRANFIKHKKDIDMSTSDFEKGFNLWCPKELSKTQINKQLHDIGIKYFIKKVKVNGKPTTCTWYKYNYVDLLNTFVKNNWIHDLDDIDIKDISMAQKFNEITKLDKELEKHKKYYDKQKEETESMISEALDEDYESAVELIEIEKDFDPLSEASKLSKLIFGL